MSSRELISDLKDCVHLFYQPRISFGTFEIKSIEVVMNSHCFENGQGSTPLSGNLGRLDVEKNMILMVLDDLKSLSNQNCNFSLCFSISFCFFEDESFFQFFVDQIELRGISFHQVEIELTYNPFHHLSSCARNRIELLKNQGVCFSIDAYSQHYHSIDMDYWDYVHYFKIDGSFWCSQEAPYWALNHLIHYIHDSGAHVVAENVHHEQEYGFLQEQGCTLGSGSFFSSVLSREKWMDCFEKYQSGHDLLNVV